MALAALLALSVFAQAPATAQAPMTPIRVSEQSRVDEAEPIPPGVPTDDYGFVAWCYGAMDESISVYESVIPQLKLIDQTVGSPIKEPVPYAKDVAEERRALKRFAAALEAAERASPRPIAPQGAAAMQLGRSMWSQIRTQTPRQQARAWLAWGSPERCETTAKALKIRATLVGQAMAIGAPAVDGPPPGAAADAPAAPAPNPDSTAAPKGDLPADPGPADEKSKAVPSDPPA